MGRRVHVDSDDACHFPLLASYSVRNKTQPLPRHVDGVAFDKTILFSFSLFIFAEKDIHCMLSHTDSHCIT